jgi:hypothetical protein
MDYKILQFAFKGFRKWVLFAVILGIFIFGFSPYFLYFTNKNTSVGYYYSYPKKALDFLKTQPLSDNMLNEYGWGGYLIWKLPERKVFIDGRMPSWREDGQFVFGDYIKIMNGRDVESIIKKYNIKIIFLNIDKIKEAEKYDEYQKKLEKSNFSKFLENSKKYLQFFGINIPEKNIYSELTKSGWKTVYADDIAIILKK